MLRIEHIGIAVKDLSASSELFTRLLGNPPYKTESVESERVTTVFFRVGESKIELLEAQNPESAIAKFIERRGEGIHHIAFEVEDIEKEVSRLLALGFEPAGNVARPFRGADNKLVFFFHPKTTNGVLIELCQEIR
ncbi:MAG: methylmalonyl-CoA epimerase [Chitinophagales bacterium]|nr:methylmalonyl-CoA epimerase [Chitinophagales bacterium]MDW8418433.1 methylmalonyl-CoA epimerase [Chitinophagales bacterium]